SPCTPGRDSRQTTRRTDAFATWEPSSIAGGALLASLRAVPPALAACICIRDGGGGRGPFSTPDSMAPPRGREELPARRRHAGSRDGGGRGARLRTQGVRGQAGPPAPGDRAV